MTNPTYPGPENIHRHVLPNGITVLVYEYFAADFVVIDGLLRAGALAVPRDQAGLAALTARMLLRGTATRDFDAIYDALESVGAGLSFSSGRHIADFSGKSLSEDFDQLLAIIGEALRRPAFPAEQVERLRGEVLTSLQIRANDTRRMAALAFRELLYGADHPYGISVSGYPETVPGLSREDLLRFHRDYYGPEGMIVSVVGAIEADVALEKVAAALGEWRNPEQRALPPVPGAERPKSIRRVHLPMNDKSQSDVVLGLPGPPRSADDYLHISMANTILGVFGMAGRIGRAVREEQGLAYYAFSRLQGGLGPSPWYASTGVAPGNVEQAIASVRDEIRRIQDEPVDGDELADSVAYRTGSLPVSLETVDGLAGVILDMELYELGLDYLQRFPEMMRAITPEQVQAAARKYLSADEIAVAVAGPEPAGS
jgi:zinc protease